MGLADDELRQAKSLLDDARRRAAEMEAELQDQQSAGGLGAEWSGGCSMSAASTCVHRAKGPDGCTLLSLRID